MSSQNAAAPTPVRRTLTLFGFFAMTASMVMAVYEYPSFGTSKFSCVFFALLGGLFWFLPMALMAAEMASVDGWSEGGIFGWVSNALHNERLGFMALFFQWFQITVGYVTMSYVIIGLLSEILGWPALNDSPGLKFVAVLVIFFGVTLLQLGGTKHTAAIAKIGFIVGILCSAIILFVFAIVYLAQGHPVQIRFGARQFFPDFSQMGTLTIFATFILAYTGVEASGSHVNELQKPGRNYPLAMFILVAIAIIFDSLGGISVASVIPEKELSLNAGIYQTLDYLMYVDTGRTHHLTWLLDLVCLLICFGVIAEIGSWVVGPSKGLQGSAWYGLMPKWVSHQNKYGVPTFMIAAQFCVVAVWDAVLTFGGGSDGNMSFLIATTLTSLVYLVCYLLMYVSYFRLIYTEKELKRTYNVPGGTVGKTIFACCGLLCSLFAFAVSFIPTSALPVSDGARFVVILTYCFLGTVILAFTIPAFRRHYLKKLDPSEIRVMHFRLLWRRVPTIMQDAVDAARKRNHVTEVDGHLVQMLEDKNGEKNRVERSDRFEDSGF
ncbi:MAG: amino acid permease [Aeriscardovia sp.]|nr:amino acid permease [Aeriscardovia sp.]